ncbi:hypothetical protein SS50377_21633 [Spironucleus salmonicida]|uniref:Uncharacterized protein n=1 Tax=Spironucleus salmonicida TaxID=348837 RepID=A0A9P8LWX0_9EUKA|nr:hypothetical protein SS50377_21633 [Spironucleus salmonicida]
MVIRCAEFAQFQQFWNERCWARRRREHFCVATINCYLSDYNVWAGVVVDWICLCRDNLLYSSWSKYSFDEFEISISYHTQEYEIQLQGNFKVMVQQHVILLYLSIMLSEFENNQSMQN